MIFESHMQEYDFWVSHVDLNMILRGSNYPTKAPQRNSISYCNTTPLRKKKKTAFPDIQIRTMEILFAVGNERQAA